MAFRDSLKQFGINTLGAVGETLVDLASARMAKADNQGRERGERDQADAPAGTEHPDERDSDQIADLKKLDKAKDDPRSLLWDPYALIEQLGYKDRPSQITYGTLRAIVYKLPIIQAVIQTRVNQLAAFATPSHDQYSVGFKLTLRESEKSPTKAARIWIKDMEDIIMRTGVTDNPRGRDDFEVFIRKLAWDSLVYDQMTFEMVPNRRGLPAEWYAVDAATMRLADARSMAESEDDTKAIRYVQIYDSMIINEYSQEELCFGVRNPRTDIYLHGYGVSELEMLIQAVTSLLYGWEYNQKFFSQGSAAKGILNFKGAIPEQSLQAFRRQWYAQISGVQNAWRTPIVNSEDLQWINMQGSNREMEYSAWMDFMIKVCCSMYSMDPVELNFSYGNVGQRSALKEASNKEKITESKERGLRPLMRFIARCLNQNIIWPIHSDFEFKFVGLDSATREDRAELITKRVKSIWTVDELRAEEDRPPLPDGKGEVILDSVWLQAMQAAEAQKQQEQQGGQGEQGEQGGPGGSGGEAPGGKPGEKPGGGEDEGVDFESALAQYAEENPEGEGGEEEERPGKPGGGIQGPGAQKSLKSWSITL